MHVTIEGRHLAKALKTVKTVIERRNTIPVLSMARLTFYPSPAVLNIVGTDLDMELSAQIDIIDVSDDFDMVVPASLLYEAARFAGSASVRIESREDVTREPSEPPKAAKTKYAPTVLRSIAVIVGDGDQEYQFLQQAKPEDWPWLIETETLIPAPVPLETFTNGHLRELLDATAQCISTEETRYYLNGVYWRADKDGAAFTATDGHRLTSKSYKALAEAEVNEIIPRKAVSILREIAGGDVRSYRIDKGRPVLVFETGNLRLVTKTIDGTFPDYRRVIPQQGAADHIFEFDAGKLKDALTRAIAFYRTQSRTALCFKPGKDNDVIVSGSSSYEPFIKTETNFNAKTFAPWPDMNAPAFGLNMFYLDRFVPKTGTIRLRLKDAGSPILVQIDGEDDVTRVVMPMRV